MDSIPERLARVETSLDALTITVNHTAADVRAVRDHMITSKAKAAGSWKTLSLIGSLVVGTGLVAGGVGAIAVVFIH